MPPSASGQTRVVILGGGPAALAAAFWLTSTDALRAQYQVTIYTPGWRLGGKCASGRDRARCNRIEEHGLHVLMGCYHYAFHTIRRCFDEWQPLPGGPFQMWTDAFTECYDVSLGNLVSSGSSRRWEFWNFEFPQLAGLPGDVDADGNFADAIWDGATPPALGPLMSDFTRWLEDHVTNKLPPELLIDHDHHETLRQARDALGGNLDEGMGALVSKLDALAHTVREAVITLPEDVMIGRTIGEDSATAAPTPDAGLVCPFACVLVLAELGFWLTSGYIKELIAGGSTMIERLNAFDFRQWLSSLGVSSRALSSPPIRALYDLAFAYRAGDSSSLANGSMAAGVTLRLVLEMTLGYRRAPLWKMNAGTADAVFTPMYEVLTKRKVSFKFFHRLSGLALSGGKIGVVNLEQQAEIVDGMDYRPLVNIGNLGCWPDAPDWYQLVDGQKLSQRGVNFESPNDPTVARAIALEVGRDFDLAVLAVPPDVIKRVAGGLTGADARWDAMLSSAASVATEAFQLWMKPDLSSLGWTLGPVLTSFAEPFDSWADMSHLLPHESWGTGADAPHSIHYFCGCLPDSVSTPNPEQDAARWLASSIASLWPQAASPGSPPNPALVASAYYRANSSGSERYVQTPAGTVASRLSPSAPMFGNLYVAGDWTLTRFSGGCFEAAMESGTLAASAICGFSVLQR